MSGGKQAKCGWVVVCLKREKMQRCEKEKEKEKQKRKKQDENMRGKMESTHVLLFT